MIMRPVVEAHRSKVIVGGDGKVESLKLVIMNLKIALRLRRPSVLFRPRHDRRCQGGQAQHSGSGRLRSGTEFL
jgi:hypothetical protein